MIGCCVAVDMGAANVRVAIGKDFRIVDKLVEETDRLHGAEGLSRQIVRMIHRLTDRSGSNNIRAIGIGSIGPLDLKKGEVTGTPNLPFPCIPLVEPLSRSIHV